MQLQAEDGPGEPRGERQQRNGRDPLHPPVADALARRAAAEHLAERTAQAHAATPGARLKARQPSQTATAVMSSAATMTTAPLRRACARSRPRPVSQTR